MPISFLCTTTALFCSLFQRFLEKIALELLTPTHLYFLFICILKNALFSGLFCITIIINENTLRERNFIMHRYSFSFAGALLATLSS